MCALKPFISSTLTSDLLWRQVLIGWWGCSGRPLQVSAGWYPGGFASCLRVFDRTQPGRCQRHYFRASDVKAAKAAPAPASRRLSATPARTHASSAAPKFRTCR